ncbi:CHAT domain-containing protein [Micromonospora sp. NBC_00362]|uniref:CHAT domain-containing protein n=1 Tax=Micromonospora sp. NBC_00362 TaxID=2975975 RepID=UPI00225338B0|nr:CHAT domain-containing protein [Micromonospora sp. NBC_00362]MCX5116075.1 CHAT domain-containing protein [Micromonospora sp. NBC_00362]
MAQRVTVHSDDELAGVPRSPDTAELIRWYLDDHLRTSFEIGDVRAGQAETAIAGEVRPPTPPPAPVDLPGAQLRVIVLFGDPDSSGQHRLVARQVADRLGALRTPVGIEAYYTPHGPDPEKVVAHVRSQAEAGRPFHLIHVEDGVPIQDGIGALGVPIVVLPGGRSDPASREAVRAQAVRIVEDGAKAVITLGSALHATAAAEFLLTVYDELLSGGHLTEAVAAGRRRLAQGTPDSVVRRRADRLLPALFLSADPRIPRARTDREPGRTDEKLNELRDARGNRPGTLHSMSDPVGCDSLIAATQAAARQKRPVILHGPSGSGKSEAARAFGRWWVTTGQTAGYERVLWHPIESGAPTFAAAHLAAALSRQVHGRDHQPLRPGNRAAWVDRVLTALSDRPMLIFLDGLEIAHSLPDPGCTTPVLTAAEAGEFADFVRRLTETGSTVVITSRTTEDWIVDATRIEARGFGQAEAMEFTERQLSEATRSRPAFLEVMRRIGGNPLSLRLAVPLLQSGTPEQFLAESGLVTALPAEEQTSLPWVFAYALTKLSPHARRQLVVTSLFRDYADLDALGLVSRHGHIPARIADRDADVWKPILEEASRAGLYRYAGSYLYLLDPAVRRYLDLAWRVEAAESYEAEHGTTSRFLYHIYAQIGPMLLKHDLAGEDPELTFWMIHFQRHTYGTVVGGALADGDWGMAATIYQPLDELADSRCLYAESLLWFERCRDALDSDEGWPPPLGGRAGTLWHQQMMAQARKWLRAGDVDHAERLYLQVHDAIAARDEFTKSLRVLEHQLGRVAETRQRWDDAERWYRRALVGMDESERANTYHQLGFVAENQGDLEEAERLYRQSLDIVTRAGDRAAQTIRLQSLAIVARKRDRLGAAEHWLRLALDAHLAMDDRIGTAAVYRNLGEVLEERGRLEDAEQLYRRSAELFLHKSETTRYGDVCRLLGLVTQRRGKPAEAQHWQTQFVEVAEQVGDPRAMADGYDNLGQLLDQQDRPDEAKTWFRKIISLGEERDSDGLILRGRHALGRLHLRRHEEEAAEHVVREGLVQAQRLDRGALAGTYGLLAQIGMSRGDTGQALDDAISGVALFDDFHSVHGRTILDSPATSLITIAKAVGFGALEERWQTVTGTPLPDEIREQLAFEEALGIDSGTMTRNAIAAGMTDRGELSEYLHAMTMWWAYQAGLAQADMTEALVTLGRLMPDREQLVPEPLRELLRTMTAADPGVADSDPAAWGAEARRLMLDPHTRADPAALDRLIGLLRSYLGTLPEGSRHWAASLTNLATQLQHRFRLNGSAADLDEVIEIGRTAVAAFGDMPEPRAAALFNLSNGLVIRYEASGATADLDEAIEGLRIAADLPSPHHNRILSTLAVTLRMRFERTGAAGDGDDAVTLARQALNGTDPSDPELLGALMSLSAALLERFQQRTVPADIEEAAEYGHRAVTAAQPGGRDRMKALSNLGRIRTLLFGITRRTADIDGAVEATGQAVDLCDEDDPDRPSLLVNHVGAMAVRYTTTGRDDGLEAVLDDARRCADRTVPTVRSQLLSGVAIILQHRYRLSMRPEDGAAAARAVRAAAAEPEKMAIIDVALGLYHGSAEDDGAAARLIASSRAEIEAAEADGTQPGSTLLSMLGGALLIRFEQSGERADLEEAIAVLRRAVSQAEDRATPRPSSDLRRVQLASALLLRSEVEGSRDDIEEAVTLLRDAVTGLPAEGSDRVIAMLSYAWALHGRFRYSSDVGDLDLAAAVSRRAIASTPTDHPGSRVELLTALAEILTERYRYTGNGNDLMQAVQVSREVTETLPADDPARIGHLISLASRLHTQYEHDADPATLAAAITTATEVTALAPPGAADHAAGQATLARILLTASEPELGGDIDLAVDAALRAVNATTVEDVNRPQWLAVLAEALVGRALTRSSADDLQLAAEALISALHLDPGNASLRADWANLFDLGMAGSPDPETPKYAMRYWHDAALAPRTQPAQQARSARAWAERAAVAGDLGQVREAVELVTGLLPQLVEEGLSEADRLRHLEDLQGLGPLAAWMELAADPPRLEAAWERLENGRAFLVRQALDAHNDLTGLRHDHPSIAEDVEQLRWLLAQSHRRDHTAGPGGYEPRELASQWRDLLDRIRALPGHERFGLPPTVGDLRAVVGERTVVAINVTPYGCAALILTADTADHVPLPELRQDRLREQADRFLRAVDPGPDHEYDADGVRAVLAWLWDTTMEPVLHALGHTTAIGADEAWPQICWMPTDVLSMLPLHAAGHHDDDEGDPARRITLDRVVSSYTLTVRSLDQRGRPDTIDGTGVLLVGSNSPVGDGYAPLALAEAECEAVRRILGAVPEPLVGDRANPAAVLAALPGTTIAHFACHAVADFDDPAAGYLQLHDDVLTVGQLMSADAPRAWLAYLSACTTGVVSPRLLNEPVHLASAFQIAGFVHTIATLWPISDVLAPFVAWHLYRNLTRGLPPAVALHHTIHAVRKRHPHKPQFWASHIHFGP